MTSRVKRGLSAALLAVVLLPMVASAQSAQAVSLQISGLGSVPFGGGLATVKPGPGWEAQLRFNPSAFSVGFGVEQSFHDLENFATRTVTLLGAFFEPRYVIDVGSDAAAPYLAGRAAVSSMTLEDRAQSATATGFTLNGGGGVLIRLGPRTNLDLGASIGYKKLGEAEFGPSLVDMGEGSNVIARVGLAIGLGG